MNPLSSCSRSGFHLMGHGLQKLVPPGYSPPLLHAAGHRGTGAGFESLGIRPAVAAAVLAGSAELAAGFSLAAGLLTPAESRGISATPAGSRGSGCASTPTMPGPPRGLRRGRWQARSPSGQRG